MTDWQTGLMQQVADPGLFDCAELFGLAGPGRPFTSPNRQHARNRAGAPVPHGARRSSEIKHIGPVLPEVTAGTAVGDLVALLLRRRPQERVEAFVDAALARGLPAEHIYLRMLQPAARCLGEMWIEDTCTFVDVTLATAGLQSAMRHLSPRFHQHARPGRGTRSVVLGTLGSDQHTFGLAMAAEFFRRSGWTVCSTAGGGEIAGRLRGERNAVVGFSVSRADQLPELSATIRQVRRLGRDRVAGILVGGPLAVTRPELARESGADAVGFDARQAVAEAESLAAAGECG